MTKLNGQSHFCLVFFRVKVDPTLARKNFEKDIFKIINHDVFRITLLVQIIKLFSINIK